jgi:hypothetical protein
MCTCAWLSLCHMRRRIHVRHMRRRNHVCPYAIWMFTCRGPTNTKATYTAHYDWHSLSTTHTYVHMTLQLTLALYYSYYVSVYYSYYVYLPVTTAAPRKHLYVCVCVCVVCTYYIYIYIYIIRIHMYTAAPHADTAVVWPTYEEEDTSVSWGGGYVPPRVQTQLSCDRCRRRSWWWSQCVRAPVEEEDTCTTTDIEYIYYRCIHTHTHARTHTHTHSLHRCIGHSV